MDTDDAMPMKMLEGGCTPHRVLLSASKEIEPARNKSLAIMALDWIRCFLDTKQFFLDSLGEMLHI